MLAYLKVSNFAIIENIEVSFEAGMNVLTGETGAGKSLLIDAIGLLLGERASSDVVRTGEKSATITAVFSPLNDAVKHACEDHDIPLEDDELLIKRTIKPSSGNIIKVNGETITLSQLRELTRHLADIHTQHDTKRLINPTTYLTLIDQFDPDIKTLKDDYREKKDAYLHALEAYDTLQKDKQATLEKREQLETQSEELAAHELKSGEMEAIEERLATLQNFDQLFHSLKTAHTMLEESQAIDHIYDAAGELDRVSHIDEAYDSLKSRMESAYYELDDIRGSLYDRVQQLDFDPDELETLENRKYALDSLRRKYSMDIEALIEYHEEINEKITGAFDYDTALSEAMTHVTDMFEALKDAAVALSDKRKITAQSIEARMHAELSALELKDASFTVRFDAPELKDPFAPAAFKEDGIDTIDFMLTTNAGEPQKPLKKVASGGELSRIMLALKTLLVFKESLNLMIFDEIDTGVSGYVATQVANKMHAIAESVQVLAITHLPQVAARADQHYYIYKDKAEGRTTTNLKLLSHQHRVEALAAMISSGEVTKRAIESAKELLQ